MSEAFTNGGEKIAKEVYVHGSGYSGQTSVTVPCGFSSKPGTVKIHGYLVKYSESYYWGIYNNVAKGSNGMTVTTFTVTDNLNGTVTISSDQPLYGLYVAIVKTLT